MTTTKRQPNRATEINAITGLIAGAKKRFANVTQVTLSGATITLVTLLGTLQGMLDQIAEVEVARSAFQTKLKALNTLAPPARALASAFTALVRVTFGNQSDVLADFAMAPRKAPPPKTLEQKQAAADKNRATRVARGTKGPKARLAVTGTVAPATTPVTPAAAAEPAAPATVTAATPPKP